MRWTVLAGILGGCVFEAPESACEELAIQLPDGEVDPCDLSACEACEAECGTGKCTIAESFPPQYGCEAGSWTVYDECPDWEAPEP